MSGVCSSIFVGDEMEMPHVLSPDGETAEVMTPCPSRGGKKLSEEGASVLHLPILYFVHSKHQRAKGSEATKRTPDDPCNVKKIVKHISIKET